MTNARATNARATGLRAMGLGALALLAACADAAPPETNLDAANLDAAGAPAAERDTSYAADSLFRDGGRVRLNAPTRARLEREDPRWAAALRLHYDALVLDGHLDTPSWMLDGYDLGARHTPRADGHHVDLPRMAEGGLDGGFFSIYVPAALGETPAATAHARALIAEVRRQVEAHAGQAGLATSAADVRRLAAEGRRAILLGLEGGHALQGSEAVLAELAGLGVRYVTLTHTNTNGWADSSQDAPRWGGLNDRGRALVAAMNRLGVLVDVSHVSDEALADALAASRAPVIASHSSARALVRNVRNLSDDQLRAIAAGGGVVMVNVFDHVVNGHLTPEVMDAVDARLARDHGGNPAALWTAVRAERAARGLPPGTVEDVVDHLDHVARVAGVDHVGLGSDFDGVPALPDGLPDVTRLPWLTHGLLARGYSAADVRKILGGNTLRVLAEAERVARAMQAAPAR